MLAYQERCGLMVGGARERFGSSPAQLAERDAGRCDFLISALLAAEGLRAARDAMSVFYVGHGLASLPEPAAASLVAGRMPEGRFRHLRPLEG